MPPTPPVEIKVIYDSSKRRQRYASIRRVGPGSERRIGSLLLLGVLSLAVSGGLYYATWWRLDPFFNVTLIMKTPVDVDLDAAGTIFGVPPTGQSAPSEPIVGQTSVKRPPWGGKIARAVIPITAYSWLTLSTLAVCALALSSGATLGHRTGRNWRRLSLLVTVVLVFGLCLAVYRTWSEYQAQYPMNHLRIGMGGLALLGLTLGLSIGRGVLGLTRLAAVVTILSAVGSAVGLYLGARCGAIDPPWSSPTYMGLVFVVHSMWGWILLVVARRVGS